MAIFEKMVGYRTYTAMFAVLAHQIVKLLGVDIPNENFSITFDTVMALIVIFLKRSYKAKEQQLELPN